MNEEREPNYTLAEIRTSAWNGLKFEIIHLPKRLISPYQGIKRRRILRIALIDMADDVKTIIKPRRELYSP